MFEQTVLTGMMCRGLASRIDHQGVGEAEHTETNTDATKEHAPCAQTSGEAELERMLSILEFGRLEEAVER